MSRTEPRESWLSQAIIRLGKLPTNDEWDFAIYRLSLRLLKGIEADGLPVPIIRKSKSGAVHIYWSQGPRSLEIAVYGPTRYSMMYYEPGRVVGPTDHRGGHVDAVRDRIRLLFQWANSGGESEMNTYAEVIR